MTTVKPSAARRSATAAPMPREAPVTMATLLVSLVIFVLLMIVAGCPRSDGRNLIASNFRIIMHYSASQSGNGEQSDGPFRRDAGVHPGGGAAQLFARRRGSRPAALDRDRRREDAGSASRRAAAGAHHAAGPPDAGRRGALPALPVADRRSRGCRRRVRRRQAEGPVAARGAGHAGASFPAAEPAGLFRAISRHRDQHERERPLDRPDPRRRRLRAALRPFAGQRHDRAPGGGAGAADLRRAELILRATAHRPIRTRSTGIA